MTEITALLLDVHPVGHSVLGALLALDGTGLIDGSTVQQQLSVRVVLPASGWLMIANVRRRSISSRFVIY
mgnify:CR=1 FL=1